MDTEKRRKQLSVSNPVLAKSAWASIFLCIILSACGGTNNTPSTPSHPATVPTETHPSFYPIILTPTLICQDGLVFINDVTIPDYSIISPGSLLDKQWLVQNSGSCNWDNHYRLRLVDGDTLGASPEHTLFPARAGLQATLRIIFTSPEKAGEYFSEWQAFDAKGIPFGETFFIKIIVQ